MPKLAPTDTVDKILATLVKQRQEHVDALAKIDAVFTKYGINPDKAKPAPAPAAAAAIVAKPRAKKAFKRGIFSQTAEEMILGMLAGGKSVTGAQIKEAWKKAGRKGSADNTLSLMVGAKKLKRAPVKNGRGSYYSLA